MQFCTNCGNQLNEGAAFCTGCGNAVSGANQTAQPSGMYEEFVPFLGVGKRFIFTENSLIYGSEEYPYAQLSSIALTTAATALSNGVAQATADNGVILTLAYVNKDNERFGVALTYANEQIDVAHGNTKNHKYLLQSPAGSKIEVYDDYLMLYYVPLGSSKGSESVDAIGKGFGMSGKGLGGKLAGGLGKALDSVASVGTVLSNSTKGGATGNIIMFTDLNIQINADNLIVNEYSIPISPQNLESAKEIIAYIEETLNTEDEAQAQPIEQELWEPIKGVAKAFPLFGETLEVPENLDVFNAYRLKFRELAFKYADKAEKEYKSKVCDFVTFIEFFPKIYFSNLEPLIQKAVDILIAEEVWTVTFDSLFEQHTADFHLALEDYETIIDSANLTVEANQQATAGLMSFVPNMVGGGFGLKGALKGMAQAAAFNAVRDGIENSAIKNAANIKPAQQAELYGRIKFDILAERIYTDYWRVFLSLVWTLNQNENDIWWQTDEVDQKAKNIFQNLSNPNFPQTKVLAAVIGLLELNPYSPDYYEFLISRFGESEEVTAIKDYFGYTGTDPRIR